MNAQSPPAKSDDDIFPSELREKEEQLIQLRREKAGNVPKDDPKVGIALSGGGIRSATFSLGVFQALAAKSLVRKIDYLSTVSGGGYFGSFLGRLFTRPWINGEQPPPYFPQGTFPSASPFPQDSAAQPATSEKPATPFSDFGDTISLFRSRFFGPGKTSDEVVRCYDTEDVPSHAEGIGPKARGVERVEYLLNCPASQPMSWLRDNGRYLSPNGASDTLIDAAVAVRNWASLSVVMSLFIILFFLGFNLLRAAIWRFFPQEWVKFVEMPLLNATGTGHLWWSPYLVLPLVVLALAVVPLAWAFWLTQGGLTGKRLNLPPLTAFLTGMLTAAAGYLAYFYGRNDLAAMWFSITGLSLLALLWWGSVSRFCPIDKGRPGAIRWLRNKLSLYFKTAMVVTAVLLLLGVADSFGQSLYAILEVTGWDVLFSWKILAAVSGVLTILTVARNLAFLLEKLPMRRAVRLPLDVVAVAFAIVLSFVLAVSLAVIAHGFAWGWSVPGALPVVAAVSETGNTEQPIVVNPGLNMLSPLIRQEKVSLSPENHIVVSETNETPEFSKPKTRMSFWFLFRSTLICLFLALSFGQTFTFLNLSSLQQLYGARLVRSYLGASNPNRWRGHGQRLSDVVHCDDVRLEDYRPHEHGGPLHLINVTLNETFSGKSNVEFRDRKGLPMAVGPCGLSVGLRDHATWFGEKDKDGNVQIEPIGFREKKFHALAAGPEPHPVEALTLGHWIALSGAAFTTGLGEGTSLGKSLLLGLSNVRLGYWWDSHIRPKDRKARTPLDIGDKIAEFLNRIFYVQTSLLNEFLGRFHGPARRLWYLSDGGHFENTAAYELLRRRVPFIIVCDNGCDPETEFGDLAALVRKARIDFGAEIEFLGHKKSGNDKPKKTTDSADAPMTPRLSLEDVVHSEMCGLFGEPEDFKSSTSAEKAGEDSEAKGPPSRLKHHALLGRVSYPKLAQGAQHISWLLVLKPGLTGDEPLDIIQYQKKQTDFPQESTADQYFDEAQWESYRRLGEHIASLVFAVPSDKLKPGKDQDQDQKWSPSDMSPPGWPKKNS